MDVLIFDMDGVLIDVSKSYRKTIQQTIHTYIDTCLGFKRGRRSLATNEEISLFKAAGGFNNDWDLTSGILLYLLSVSTLLPSQRMKRCSSIDEVLLHLKKETSRLGKHRILRIKKKRLIVFLKKVKSSGGGLTGVRRVLKASWDGWVYQSGDLDKENLVKRIFQEIYLGKKFFSCYRLPRIFYKGTGYYLRESLLISRNLLTALRKKLRLAIASGRPRFEAELALKRFHLLSFFDSVVSLDECKEEENRILKSTGKKMNRSKPHPYSILKAVKEIGISSPRCGYVGDVVDDMVAARAAERELSILAIGFLSGRRNRNAMEESLLQGGADLVIKNPRELLRFIA